MEVTEISKSYGKQQILDRISLQIAEGTCVGIVGANGCGKSTLFRILAGVEKADAGKVFSKERIGYVPQADALLDELSVKDNIRLFASMSGRKISDADVRSLCEKFSIGEFIQSRVDRLSGGMRKRVSIVCALLGNPEILILDEPSAALDIVFKEELKQYIREYTDRGGSVLLTSHDRDEMALCDKLYVMKDRKLIPVEALDAVQDLIRR